MLTRISPALAVANWVSTHSLPTSAANPKFAQLCETLRCELRVQKRHYKNRVASVLIDSEVRMSAPQMLTNFGIGTLGRKLVKANVKSKAPLRLIFASGPL